MLLSCDNLTVASSEEVYLAVPCHMVPGLVLPEGAAKTNLCLAQLPAVALYLSMHPGPNGLV